MNAQLKGSKALRKNTLAYVAIVLAVSWFTYFALRFLVSGIIPREPFTLTLGLLISMLGVLIFLKVRIGRVMLGTVLWAGYLIIQFVVRNQWDEIHIIALGQYLVPIGFSMMGIYLWRKNFYRIIIKVLLLTIFFSICGGLANFYLGWGESILVDNILESAEINSEIFQRAGSLAGGSLGTGFIAMAGVLLSLGSGLKYKLMIPFLVLSLFSTLSRGGLTMLSVGIGVILLLSAYGKSFVSLAKVSTIVRLLPIGLLALGSMLLVVTAIPRDVLTDRFLTDLIDFEMEIGNVIRLESWMEAIRLWLDKPFFGHGVGIIGTTAVVRGISPLAAESMYLQILSELGVAGLLLYLAAVVPSLLLAWKGLRSRPDQHDRLFIQSLIGCTLAILAGGVYLQNLGDYTGSLFWYLIGGLAGYATDYSKPLRLYAWSKSCKPVWRLDVSKP